MTATSTLSGGCQCGAVRYRLHATPTGAAICHCRMCQKAVGGYFGAYAGVPKAKLEWTRGEIATYMSSAKAERGFCIDCGTPLTFRYIDKDRISVTLGSLDDPKAVPPGEQYGIEGRMPFFAEMAHLPGTVTEDDIPPERMTELKSRQHPDHDTR